MTTDRKDIVAELDDLYNTIYKPGHKTGLGEIEGALTVPWPQISARLKAAEALLEVPGRKMHFLVRDYPDDKESVKWLENYETWRKLRKEKA